MDRKILILSTFITLGAVTFLSGYLLMPEQNLGQQAGTLLDRFNNSVEVGLSDNKSPDAVLLSSRKFLSFVNPYSNSQKIVAVDNGGNIFEIDLSTLNEKVVYRGQTTILEALLSSSGDSLIYSFYDARNNKKHTYLNFKKGESTPIVGNLRHAAFSSHGDQAVYLVSNEDGGELLISKGVNIIKRMFKTRLGAAVVSWPSDFVSIVSYDKDGYGDLLVLKENGALNKILSYQYGLSVKWSPLGEKVIFSAKDNSGFDRLFYKDVINNGTVVALDVSTNASKCVWTDEKSVICGIRNQTYAKDEFYKIKTTDSSKTLVSTPTTHLLVREVALNRSGDTIFVLNDIDKRLYALKTK